MKKLKIFLPILLISLFFIPKVNASTSTYNATLKYSDSFISTINDNQERIDNLRSYISNLNCLYNNQYCVNTGNYIMIITGSTMSTNTWQVRLVTTNTTNDYMYIWWRTSYSDGRLLMTGNGITYNFNFSGNNVTSHNNRSTGGFYCMDIWNTNGWSGNPMNNDVEIEINNYVDTYFLNENRTINFKTYGQSGFYDVPIELNNEVKTPTISINAKELFDSLLPYSNPFACNIDINSLSGFRDSIVSNIDEFSIHVKGVIPDDSNSFDGSFALKSNSNRLVNDPNINFDLDIVDLSGENIGAAATYDWYNDENILVVSYSLGNSSGENIDMIISIKPDSSSTSAISFFSKSLSVFYCNPLNLNDDITYGYIDSDTDVSYSSDTSLMNFLNNNNSPDLSFFSNLNTVLPTGPVDQILTLPLTMLSTISNAMGDTCNPITFTIPYLNEDITIPCMNTFYDNIGATGLFNVIGGIASVLILGEYFIFLYNWVDNTLRFGEHKLRMWGASVK